MFDTFQPVLRAESELQWWLQFFNIMGTACIASPPPPPPPQKKNIKKIGYSSRLSTDFLVNCKNRGMVFWMHVDTKAPPTPAFFLLLVGVIQHSSTSKGSNSYLRLQHSIPLQ